MFERALKKCCHGEYGLQRELYRLDRAVFAEGCFSAFLWGSSPSSAFFDGFVILFPVKAYVDVDREVVCLVSPFHTVIIEVKIWQTVYSFLVVFKLNLLILIRFDVFYGYFLVSHLNVHITFS